MSIDVCFTGTIPMRWIISVFRRGFWLDVGDSDDVLLMEGENEGLEGGEPNRVCVSSKILMSVFVARGVYA